MNHENSSWVFDSLVGFLHGPVWNAPLQTFIEEKSLTFDPTEHGDVQIKTEYKGIHEEYKNLVDVMLGSFMEDMGIQPDQFEEACRASRARAGGTAHMHFHRRLFQQIWAANDLSMFVRMMTQRNVELQLQALELIERRFGTMPQLFEGASGSGAAGDEGSECDSADEGISQSMWTEQDVVIMKELKKMSLNEGEEDDDDDVTEGDSRKMALPESVANLSEEKKILENNLQVLEKQNSGELLGSMKEATETGNLQESLRVKLQSLPKKKEIDEDELKGRQEYLKRQRDKLLAMKKRIRSQQLEAGTAKDGASARNARPKSAHTAARLLAGDPPPATPMQPDPEALAMRKALAERLKAEVVHN